MFDVNPIVWIVVPCYNEGASGGYCIKETFSSFSASLCGMVHSKKCSAQSRILYVDDGSSDDTWDVIQEYAKEFDYVSGIKLSRNRGHQNALLAGLMEAKEYCDLAISMDCDGQDDFSVIEDMIEAYKSGFDIAYGVRSNRDTDSIFKRFTAETFYKFMNSMGAETVFNHADYRMMSKRAIEGLSEFGEVNLFLRGIVPMVGYPSTIIEYSRSSRVSGESHYPIGKMISLALNGITSLSVRPIRIASAAGLLFSLMGLFGVIWAIVAGLSGEAVAGWASTICVICFMGGLQMFSLGIIGEYIGKIYLETKHRPRYIIETRTYS